MPRTYEEIKARILEEMDGALKHLEAASGLAAALCKEGVGKLQKNCKYQECMRIILEDIKKFDSL